MFHVVLFSSASICVNLLHPDSILLNLVPSAQITPQLSQSGNLCHSGSMCVNLRHLRQHDSVSLGYCTSFFPNLAQSGIMCINVGQCMSIYVNPCRSRSMWFTLSQSGSIWFNLVLSYPIYCSAGRWKSNSTNWDQTRLDVG